MNLGQARHNPDFRLDTERGAAETTVTVSGRLDAETYPILRAALDGVCSVRRLPVIVDLTRASMRPPLETAGTLTLPAAPRQRDAEPSATIAAAAGSPI